MANKYGRSFKYNKLRPKRLSRAPWSSDWPIGDYKRTQDAQDQEREARETYNPD